MARSEIVYLVVAHRDPEQVVRLVRALAHPHCLTLLHVDAKSEALFWPHRTALESANPALRQLPSTSVTWGGLSQVRVVLNALRWLREQGIDFGHLAHVSGQCFPLRPPAEMVRRLREEQGRSFLRTRHLRTQWPRAMRRVRWLHWELPFGRRRVVGLPLPMRSRYRAFEWYGGSCWFWLSQEVASSLLDDLFAVWLLGRLRFSNSPDEIFFQTALEHLVNGDALERNNLRYERWLPDPRRQGRFLPNPKLLGREDLDALEKAAIGGALFARKFQYSSPLYDELERRLD